MIASALKALRIFALAALVSGALLSATLYLRLQLSTWNPVNLSDDPVTNWEARCEALRQDLPTHGEFGYLSEWDLPGWTGSTSDMDNEYRLTQYALAPRILVRGAEHAFVIGNFNSDESVRAASQRYGLRMVRSYGLGIYLFEKATQP